MAEDEDFFTFEEEEKEEKKSGIQELEEEIRNDLELMPNRFSVPDYDYLTGILVLGEVILLVYGALLLLAPNLIF
jgi:hypothetical protein